MKRNKSYRRLQRDKREKKVISHIKKDKYHPDLKHIKMMIDTPKMCGGDCCKNPRKNGWNNTKQALTIQELKELEDFENQTEGI